MKVLVTGATGFVGREIVRRLCDSGDEVHALARSRSSASEVSPAIFHPGNVLEASSLREPCKGMEAIIHLVGVISEVGRNKFAAVHVEGTRNIVAAARAGGVRRFIHMSSLGTRVGAASRYHQSKWAAEEIVRSSGLDWTIFRPSVIYGPGDGFVNLFASLALRSPMMPIIGRGTSKYQPVPVQTVADAFVKSLAEPRAINRTLDLCGAETFSMNQIIDEVLAVIGRERPRLHIPIWLARIQAGLLELLCSRILRKAPPLNRDQIVMLQEDNVGNGDPARELFNLQFVPFREGIAKYLKPHGGVAQVSMP